MITRHGAMRRFIIVGIAALIASALAPGVARCAGGLSRIQSSYVCMVNDTAHSKEQIAVHVEGKTYYGCCEMCKERLGRDVAIRNAVDPISGEAVDKAIAVTVATPDGKVLYFKSEATLTAFERK